MSLFLMKDAGLNKIVNLIIDHACLKNDYERKKKLKALNWNYLLRYSSEIYPFPLVIMAYEYLKAGCVQSTIM